MAGGAGVPTIQAQVTGTAMKKGIPISGLVGVGIAIIWLSGYATGVYKGIQIGKDYNFEKVANQAIKTARETLEIAKKLQEKNHLIQEENDRLKEQLSQEQNQKQ